MFLRALLKSVLCCLCLALCPGIFACLPSAGAAEDAPLSPLPAMEKFSAVAELVREKCMPCHTRGYALPFYSRVPGIRRIIERDYNDGLRAMNLYEEFEKADADGIVGEATLAKMEWVALNGTMPPAKFAMIHWGSGISPGEKKMILGWVVTTRLAHYAVSTAREDRRGEPVQPVPDSVPVDPKKVSLGKKFFYDKRFSDDDSVSCASCHAADKGGADGRRFSEGVRGRLGDVNAPTVFNAVFNSRQFWNGRAADLREQVGGPVFNPVEMDGGDWERIIAKLCRDRDLLNEFLSVYPLSWLGDSGGWTGENIADAVAEYEKTLITPNSRFDQWLKGNDGAVSGIELEGYARFKAYRCASCHVGKILGGRSFEYADLKKDYFADRGGSLASDEGLKAFTGLERDRRKFKVPTLRNVELTAPYMHDGNVATLDEAVWVMGVYLAGMDVPKGDRKRIVAFLRTLTGEYRGEKLKGKAVPE
jgi:cytochrome c peroxidase